MGSVLLVESFKGSKTVQRFFAHLGPGKLDWQNQEIGVAMQILLKFKIFDHPGPGKRQMITIVICVSFYAVA